MSEKFDDLHPQSGVIPYRRKGGDIEVLLVTSATRKRWIIPKGNLEPNMDARESARLEAYEEAGVTGRIHPVPLGAYLHDRGDDEPTQVDVFLMEVDRVLPESRWPEHDHRTRQWVTISAAREMVLEDGLKQLFTETAELLL